MDSTLIAKILVPKTIGKNAIGTAYPISKDLVLTARHVVDFEGRDINRPISISWPDIADPANGQQPYTVTAAQDNIEFFDGYDIALIRCMAPPKAHISPLILSERHPIERESWKSMGYAQVGKDSDERKKVSAMGDIFPPDTCSHVLDLESRGDAKQKEGWKGISGAPVFRGHTLIAVLTHSPDDINERLRAVSISYLLKNHPAFKKIVGFLIDAQEKPESYMTDHVQLDRPIQYPVKLFISYSHEDEDLRAELEKHLKPLQRKKVIDTWHDRKIGVGTEWQQAIDEKLETADIVLLLVSPDFLNSDYCNDMEIQCAMRKHEEKTTVVIPILLRHCDTDGAAFMKIQGLPKNLLPVKKWNDQDEAFTDIAKGIRIVARLIQQQKASDCVDNSSSAALINLSSDSAKQADIPIATRPLTELKLDAEFKKFLHEKISSELRRPEAKWLNEQLSMYFKYGVATPDLITLITESLLNCPVDAAICNYLSQATTDCILATGNRRSDVGDKVDLVRQVAEQILGWLILASIDDNAIQKVWQRCSQNNALFFKLGVDTFAGVEIVLSRGFNRKTDFPNEDNADPTGRYFISHQKSWVKYDEGETVRKILIEIWNKVFPLPKDQKESDGAVKEKEIKRLNSAIKSRRADPKSPEHYYIAFDVSEINSEFDENIYHQLLKSLKDMTVVQFGITESDSLFLIAEEDVTTAIDEFYRAINGLKGQ
ncbi:MAG: TIR domain-containing protein [Methylobacter sp.]|nr:TIR domain-containing protein [Methylobacter sp.]